MSSRSIYAFVNDRANIVQLIEDRAAKKRGRVRTELEAVAQDIRMEMDVPSAASDNKVADKVSFTELLDAVSWVTSTTKAELLGPDKVQRVCRDRWLVMYYARTQMELSTKIVAHNLGERDHTTILHGQKRAEFLLEEDEAWQRSYEALIARLDQVVCEKEGVSK